MNNNKSVKIGISSPESVMYDSSFANDFIKYLDGISDSLDEFFKLTDALRESENNKVKTLTWFEYESL